MPRDADKDVMSPPGQAPEPSQDIGTGKRNSVLVGQRGDGRRENRVSAKFN